MAGILKGIKVLEMGHWIAIPAAAAVMADWGAEVIKIEPPAGDAMRKIEIVSQCYKREPGSINWRFELHNRGKKSLVLNLNQEEGRNIINKLVRQSDIFMSNYEIMVLNRFGMDYESLKPLKPDLIYAVLTGYGTTGPDKDERGFDFSAAWARAGIQYLLTQSGGTPPQQITGMMDRITGMNIVSGIMAALFHKERTGEGQRLDFSLYHSGVWANAGDLQASIYGEPVS